ncbi:MAG: hypothetical protein IKJ01_10175 [Lachnospiraceae bacterium]|nr:hypothetical protein [Lachnospiraceae bacterium]
MIRAIRSYFVFSEWRYRIILFVVIPISFIGIDYLLSQILTAGNIKDGVEIAIMVIGASILVMAEVFGEYWFLAGINSRKGKNMEYLKTSNCFLEIMKSCLIVDWMRRWITISVVFIITGDFDMKSAEGVLKWGKIFAGICLTVAIAQIGVYLARYMTLFHFVFLIAYISGSITVFAMILVMNYPLVGGIVSGVLAVGSGMFSVWHTLKRVKGGYYDKRYQVGI